ncbi:MAG: hypothetical protein ACPL4C_05325 [Brevinematia bacterium]
MDSKLIKWFLIIVVIAIWGNMMRVSIPTIMDYFKQNEIKSQDSFYTDVSKGGFSDKSLGFDINNIRNPFVENEDKSFSKKDYSKSEKQVKSPKEVVSFFDLKGVFYVNGEKRAILEGKVEFGVSGTFYVKEGDTVIDEKIVEIGDNYVIILKEGKRIVLYGVR